MEEKNKVQEAVVEEAVVIEETPKSAPQAQAPEAEQPKERAGVFALIISFLFPIIGIIIYAVQKDKVENPKAYTWAAAAGFAVAIILRAVSA